MSKIKHTEDASKKKFKGYIQVYTGNGKGKTTAAFGAALRAAGQGLKTYIGQFLKGQEYGELAAIDRLTPWIEVEQFGRKGFIHVTKDPDAEDFKKARSGLKKCLTAMLSGKYSIIILDEVNVALYFKLISEKDIHDFLDKRPENVEVILTGRNAPDSLVKRADLVTEMMEIKHYYQKGVRSRKGIEK
ncbi:MAG: cob(I)yrinic acid a,c-diamide adenosyltransferase [Candidatus Aminicenantes bacterium]|jgi:cob(I)alamin adenosyltransferase